MKAMAWEGLFAAPRLKIIGGLGIVGKELIQMMRAPLAVMALGVMYLMYHRLFGRPAAGGIARASSTIEVAVTVLQFYMPSVALLLGVLMWAEEREEGTTAFLASLPISWRLLFLEKLTGSILVLFICGCAAFCVFSICSGINPFLVWAHNSTAYDLGSFWTDPSGAIFVLMLLLTGAASSIWIARGLTVSAFTAGGAIMLLEVGLNTGNRHLWRGSSTAILMIAHTGWAFLMLVLSMAGIARAAAFHSQSHNTTAWNFPIPTWIKGSGADGARYSVWLVAVGVAAFVLLLAPSWLSSLGFVKYIYVHSFAEFQFKALLGPLALGVLAGATLLPRCERDASPCIVDLVPASTMTYHWPRVRILFLAGVLLGSCSAVGAAVPSNLLIPTGEGMPEWLLRRQWLVLVLQGSCAGTLSALMGYSMRFFMRPTLLAALLAIIPTAICSAAQCAVLALGRKWEAQFPTTAYFIEALVWPAVIMIGVGVGLLWLCCQGSPLRSVNESKRSMLCIPAIIIAAVWAAFAITASPIDLFQATFY